ncbi:MAG: AsmA family protein [Arenicellales bacterium]|nr:AsmA family protein [Arenicellales bacterium]
MELILPEGARDSVVTTVGRLNGNVLELQGSLMLVGDDDLEASLNLIVGTISGGVSGTVSDLMEGGQADLSLLLETGDLTQSVAMFVPSLTKRARSLFSGTARVRAAIRGQVGRDLRFDDIDVTTRSSMLRLTASGSVSLVGPRQRGPLPSTRFEVLAETDQLHDLVSLYRGQVPFEASALARGVLTGSLGNFRVDDVVISASGEHGSLSANGYVERLGGTAKPWVEFTAKAETQTLGDFTKSYGIEFPYTGTGSAVGEIRGHPGDVHARKLEIQLTTDAATIEAKGSIGPFGKAAQFDMPFEIKTRELAALVKPLGATVPAGFSGHVQGRLVGESKDLNLSELKLAVASDIVTVNGGGNDGGTIGPLGNAAVFKMPISAESGDLTALADAFRLTDIFGFNSSLGGQATMSAVLGGSIGDLDLDGLSASLTNPFGRMALNGSIASLGRDTVLNLNVDAAVPDLARLEPILNWSLDQYPGVGLSGRAKLLGKAGQLRLSGVDGRIDGKGIRSGRFSGQLPDVTDLASGSITVNLAVDDLGQFTGPLGLVTAAALPARLSVNVVGAPRPGSPLFVVLDGASDDMQLQINGQINPSDKKTTFDINSRFQADNVAKVSQIFGLAIPLDGSLSLETELRRDASQDARTVNGVVRMSSSKFNAAAQGSFSWPPRSGNKLILQFEAPSLAHLSRWLPGDYLNPGPLRFEGKFRIDDQNAPFGDFAVTLGNNELSGDAVIKGINLGKFPEISVNPGEKIRIAGKFKSSRLNLLEIFPPRKGPRQAPESHETIFSSEPLSIDWIQNADLDIDLQADHLVSRGFEAKGLSTDVNVADGVLDISARSGEFSGGTFSMDIGLDTRTAPYATDFRFDINDLVLDQVPALQNVKLPLQGAIDVAIDLSGKGVSPKEIVSGSSGSLLASGTDAVIPASNADFLTGSILFGFLNLINPKEKSEFHSLDCGLIGFRIVDGIAMSRDSVALQTPDVTYLIRGGFSLKDESIVFAVKPKARKGVGISAATLTNVFRLAGTLTEPRREADLEGVAKTGATWGLAAITGGLSILAQGLFDKFTGSQDVCRIANDSRQLLLAEPPECVLHAWNQLQMTEESRVSINGDTASCSAVTEEGGSKSDEGD